MVEMQYKDTLYKFTSIEEQITWMHSVRSNPLFDLPSVRSVLNKFPFMAQAVLGNTELRDAFTEQLEESKLKLSYNERLAFAVIELNIRLKCKFILNGARRRMTEKFQLTTTFILLYRKFITELDTRVGQCAVLVRDSDGCTVRSTFEFNSFTYSWTGRHSSNKDEAARNMRLNFTNNVFSKNPGSLMYKLLGHIADTFTRQEKAHALK